jgi:DNA-binding MarR family transcriptional regulator
MQTKATSAALGVSRESVPGPRVSRAKQAADTKSSEEIGIGHLDNVLGYVLRRAQIAVFRDFKRNFEALDIRPTQYAVLSVIADHPGLKQGEVSKLLGIKRTNFVAVLDELERRGLARRSAMAADKRSRALHLTEQGAALTADIRARNAANEARLAALLPPGQQALLIELLRKLTDALGQDESEA